MTDSVCEEYLRLFDPRRDSNDRVSENASDYAARMQTEVLPRWPTEVLIEWLYRHARCISVYAYLGFENLSFSLETWTLDAIPGKEAFTDPSFFDSFRDVKLRASFPHDWLAIYMLGEGTWNTPIILLKTPPGHTTWKGYRPLRYPLHLIEGHRRLSFLNGLSAMRMAKSHHKVWLAKLINEDAFET